MTFSLPSPSWLNRRKSVFNFVLHPSFCQDSSSEIASRFPCLVRFKLGYNFDMLVRSSAGKEIQKTFNVAKTNNHI